MTSHSFYLALLLPAVAHAFFPGTAHSGITVPRAHVGPRAAAVVASERWQDPIFNDALPDPVFDDDYSYKGASKTGFVSFAEAMNGRAAMMGFTICFLQELIVGKGVLEQYGLPYDAGAVLSG
eukprot:CAMPEP_0119367896 /NCGR_PEP_ID=MMETSP1334-20130426/14623_1 /TAXON_ID=127549 /ORGANISM="Calcidiscus leptoporus, Strain RCC1130" /LENGTH=122 /DNA_ID=CAMNT_0007384415 /DNA_START=40 /DNA_END=408 /DNA_ORIENTATION=+